MHQQGILKTDDLITRFFRLCTEMCVEISYRAQAEQQHNPAASAAIIRAKCYHNLDAFVRLIALLVKHSGEATNTVTKINLLNKVQHDNENILIQICLINTFTLQKCISAVATELVSYFKCEMGIAFFQYC